MSYTGHFAKNRLIADHDTWQEWDISTPRCPDAVLKIDTSEMARFRTQHKGRICAYTRRGTTYAQYSDNRKARRLHRFILGAVSDGVIDHKNHNGLDNRRSNLRIATNAENVANSKRYKTNTSGHTGVIWHAASARWNANIAKDGKRIHLGSFKELQPAIAARTAAELQYFGEFAYSQSDSPTQTKEL